MLQPDYLKLLHESTTPKASDYFASLIPKPPAPIGEDPLLSEAKQLLAEGQPKERVIQALESLDVENKETLINKINEITGEG